MQLLSGHKIQLNQIKIEKQIDSDHFNHFLFQIPESQRQSIRKELSIITEWIIVEKTDKRTIWNEWNEMIKKGFKEI